MEEAAVQRYVDAGYSDGPLPHDKIFDQDHVATGIPEQRSDHDIQISSDTLQARMEEYRRQHPNDRLISDHGGHWKDKSVRNAFPGLADWASKWTERAGRDVAVAGFSGTGPEGESAFSDDDWIIRREDTPTRGEKV